MNKIFVSADKYGQIIPDLKINNKPAPYPVVNEREIRAAAGIMFLIGMITLFYTFFTKNSLLLNIVVPIFFLDFLLKVFQGPNWSIFGKLGQWMVVNQKPEYVGAIQKRFAWSIGLVMASMMMIIAVAMGIRGFLPLAICGTCLTFMWMETSLGLCVGCKIYGKLIDWKVIKAPDIRPACPGGVCEFKPKAT